MRNNMKPTRRGAALIIALALLAIIAVIASTALTQILRNRQEAQKNLIRQQAELLLHDALRNAEMQRADVQCRDDSEFSGETFTLTSEQQPLGGEFQVTTQYEETGFAAEVEYRNKQGTVIGRWKRYEHPHNPLYPYETRIYPD